jgi:site-specific DNA recombinase
MENSKKEIKYFIYARRSQQKSDKEINVASIDSQIKEMQEMARRQGLKVVGIFQEAKSAKIPYKRAEFQKMVEQINKGKADGILCWKMDRLARNSIDEGTIKYLLQSGIIKNIKSSDRDWYPDDNVLLSSVEFGVATQYSRDLSKHIKRGLKARLEAGYRPSNAPIGYKNSQYHIKGKEQILDDEERFPLVRHLFDLMLSGNHNPLQLVRVADEIGLRTGSYQKYRNTKLSKNVIYKMLSNTFYYGEFEFPMNSGNWYKGNHTAMITKEEYDRIQFLLGRAGKAKPKTHSFSYTGLMKCAECGATITAEEKIKHQQNGNTHYYTYYHCTKRIDKRCSQKAVTETVLDEQLLNLLKRLEIPKLFHEWAIETLKAMHEDEKKDRNALLSIKQGQYDDVVKKLDRLLEVFLANQISHEDYSAKKSTLEQEKLNLKRFLDSIDQRIDEWIRKVESNLSFAEHARKTFEEAVEKNDKVKKKEILTAFGYNLFLKDRILDIQTEKPISFIIEASIIAKSISNKLEPPKSITAQRQIKQKYASSTLLCGYRESNPGLHIGSVSFYH